MTNLNGRLDRLEAQAAQPDVMVVLAEHRASSERLMAWINEVLAAHAAGQPIPRRNPDPGEPAADDDENYQYILHRLNELAARRGNR